MFKKNFFVLISSIVLFLPSFALSESPDVTLQRTVDEVLEIIKSDPKAEAGDVTRLIEIIEQKISPYVDYPRMTRLAVGRSWRKASNEQRTEIIKQFKEMLVRSYAAAFKMYNAIVIETKPLNLTGGETETTVSSVIKLPGGAPPVEIDYEVILVDDVWKVYDVRISGISLVINYRNMFTEEIKKNGIDGLINLLKEKNSSKI